MFEAQAFICWNLTEILWKNLIIKLLSHCVIVDTLYPLVFILFKARKTMCETFKHFKSIYNFFWSLWRVNYISLSWCLSLSHSHPYPHAQLKPKKLIVPNKKRRHSIQMTNDRAVYILPLVNYNVYWPFVGHLYCMTSFFISIISFF